MCFAHAVDASPTRSASSFTKNVTLVSTCSGRKRSRIEEHLSPAKRFHCGKNPLRTRLEAPSIPDLAFQPVPWTACDERKTTAVAALPSSAFTVSNL